MRLRKKSIDEIGGIKEGYPLIPLPKKVKGLISLTKPLTVLAFFIGGVFMYLLGCMYYGASFNPLLGIGVSLTFGILHGAAQVMNQVCSEEIEIDKINKSYRAIPSGTVSVDTASIFGASLFTISILLSYIINPIFMGWIGVLCVFSLLYTFPPVRIKKRFILNNVWQGISRGFVPIIAVFSLFSHTPGLFPIALGAVIGTWVSGAQASKDYGEQGEEIKGDSAFNMKTLFVVLSLSDAVKVMGAFMASAFAMLIWFVAINVLPVAFLFMLVLAVPSFVICESIRRGWSIKITENSASWVCFYGGLCLWFMLPMLLL